MMNSKTNSAEGEVALPALVRPSTRGELARRLKNGERCEVAAHAAEMTSIMLSGWLDCELFTVTESTNRGWVIYEPNALGEARADSATPPQNQTI